MDDLEGRQELYKGFGDTLARGIELAVMPMLFGGLGWLLDRWMGLTPVLTIALFAFAIAGLGVRMYYGYQHEMDRQDDGKPWSARQQAIRQGRS